MKKTLITFIISIFLMNSSFSQISTEFQLKEASKTAVIWLNNLNSEYTNQSGETYNNYPQAYTDLSILITSKFDSLDWINDVDQMMFPPGDFARLKWTLEYATLVTSVSNELAGKIRTIQGDDFPVVTLPNVVNLNVFSPGEPNLSLRDQLGIQPHEIILGFNGELRHKKGLPFLPIALAEVRKVIPAVLLIIGEIRAREQSLIAAFASGDPETADRILSTGHLEKPDEFNAVVEEFLIKN